MNPASAVVGAVALLAVYGLTASRPAAQESTGAQAPTPVAKLIPTAHPPVPSEPSAFWFAPPRNATLTPALANFVKGVRLLEEENRADAALPLFTERALAKTPVSDYARFYTGRALLALGRYQEAATALAALAASGIEGHLPEDAAFGQAAALEAQLDFAGAVSVYERLTQRKLALPHVALWRLGAAAQRNEDLDRAIAAYRRVYFEFPLAPESEQAEEALTKLNAWSEDEPQSIAELTRADTLFQARRWASAQKSYERAREGAKGAVKDRVVLRLAACDVHLKRYRQAVEPLKGQMAGPYPDEAAFFYVTALRGLGQRAEYEREARIFADRRRESPFAEETLNNLASYFIIADEDSSAEDVFRLMVERYPAGRFAERAYWRVGWWAYREGRFQEASALFDRGAAQFPRSDYRPSWLYWSGRAWEQAGQRGPGEERLVLTATDYFNSYYGRLALRHLSSRAAAISAQFGQAAGAPAPSFPTVDRVAQLIAVGLNREALNELQYAQRLWGDSPQLTATIALVQNRLGNLRLGINAMKRAYPQWMAAGGESLPLEVQKVVFPLDYWPLLQKHAAARGLDPFLVAALVAQESTFDPIIRSSANAVGLMQVLPSTGRQFARRLKLAGYSAARLTDPETNVRLGTAIFADGVKKFGGVHFALAAYNAGDHRVTSWQRERPGMPQDVFIDDIPFPETQNYVKRILGTAEDYRRLYGRKPAAAADKPQIAQMRR
jgi:soluble lytic murein transglycosylase